MSSSADTRADSAKSNTSDGGAGRPTGNELRKAVLSGEKGVRKLTMKEMGELLLMLGGMDEKAISKLKRGDRVRALRELVTKAKTGEKAGAGLEEKSKSSVDSEPSEKLEPGDRFGRLMTRIRKGRVDLRKLTKPQMAEIIRKLGDMDEEAISKLKRWERVTVIRLILSREKSGHVTQPKSAEEKDGEGKNGKSVDASRTGSGAAGSSVSSEQPSARKKKSRTRQDGDE